VKYNLIWIGLIALLRVTYSRCNIYFPLPLLCANPPEANIKPFLKDQTVMSPQTSVSY